MIYSFGFDSVQNCSYVSTALMRPKQVPVKGISFQSGTLIIFRTFSHINVNGDTAMPKMIVYQTGPKFT